MSQSLATNFTRSLIVLLALGVGIGCGGDDDSAASGAAGSTPSVTGPTMGSVAGANAPPAGGTNTGTSGAAGSTTAPPSAGSAGTSSGTSGSSAATAGAGEAGSNAGAGGSDAPALEKFSFFVASYAAMQRLSGSPDGFGGDLRYGEADGLSGADKICTEIAEASMKGSGAKGWRAFLSVTKGPDGTPVNAIDRVGEGPWYDRLGRLVAENKTNLMTPRPTGADPLIVNDLPNEDGVPNMAPDGTEVDNHDILTGASDTGGLFSTDWAFTCHDWTSKVGSDGTPRVGHSWPRNGVGFPIGGSGAGGFGGGFGGFAGTGGRGGGRPPGGGLGGFGNQANWMSALNEAGCAPGASLKEMGPPNPEIPTVGSGGGYGGIYCFALMP